MQLRFEIPDTFWSLFRSVNREIYIEALLCINEEYEYSNYYLTREICIQVLNDMNARKRFELQREENDTDFDMLETPASRILNWLLKAGWLKRIEDYNTLVTNIVIPDYSAVAEIRACSMSAIMSSASSIPTERRIRSLLTPASSSCLSVS